MYVIVYIKIYFVWPFALINIFVETFSGVFD